MNFAKNIFWITGMNWNRISSNVRLAVFFIEKIHKYIIMSDNKLVKTIMDAATLTGLVSGIGWVAKKVVKENFTSDPSGEFLGHVSAKQAAETG